jgi:hypothetical protein
MPSILFGKEGSISIWPRDHDSQEIGYFANILLSDESRGVE